MLLFLSTFLVLYAAVATPPFAVADAPPSPGRQRVSTLDGARGVLALAVFVHHAALIRGAVRTGHWGGDLEPFLGRIGPLAVAGFFMITGFLFTGILLRENGRPLWLRLYAGRILRIAPLYLVAVAILLAAVGVRTGFRLHVPGAVLSHEIGHWLALGTSEPVPLNGQNTWLLLGVAWTLHFEWIFYACLPLLALLARAPRLALPVFGLALAVAVALAHGHPMNGDQPTAPAAAVMFLVGAVTAAARHRGIRSRLGRSTASLLALAAVAVALLHAPGFSPHNTLPLGIAFFLVAEGADIFGLLRARAALRMGDISYGIYLLHLFVLAALVAFPPTRRLLTGSLPEASIAVALAGVLVLAAATVAFRLVERPGIALGRRLFEPPRRTETAVAPRGVPAS